MSEKPKIGEPVAVMRHSDAAEQWATSTDRTIVFSVERDVEEDGTERIDYTMPAKPNAGLALAYLKRARENADVAMSWLIEAAIGADGYDALTDELSGVDEPGEAVRILQGVVERIQKVAMGGLEAPKA